MNKHTSSRHSSESRNLSGVQNVWRQQRGQTPASAGVTSVPGRGGFETRPLHPPEFFPICLTKTMIPAPIPRFSLDMSNVCPTKCLTANGCGFEKKYFKNGTTLSRTNK